MENITKRLYDLSCRQSEANAISEYEQQAIDYLYARQIEFSVTRTLDNNCPNWKKPCDCVHGDEYRIEFKRGRKSVRIKFWNSYHDKQNGNTPTAYDVLANISGNFSMRDMSFDEFCSDFGYNNDSIIALSTYKQICKQVDSLRRIFTQDDELAMQEIQ